MAQEHNTALHEFKASLWAKLVALDEADQQEAREFLSQVATGYEALGEPHLGLGSKQVNELLAERLATIDSAVDADAGFWQREKEAFAKERGLKLL